MRPNLRIDAPGERVDGRELEKELRHRDVRDLAWAITSPPLCRPPSVDPEPWLVSESERAQRTQLRSLLFELDAAPASLCAFLAARPSRRLGHRFQHLHRFWFDHDPRLRCLAESLTISSVDGRTLGELDFVYADNDRVVHLEVAVKFYLRAAPEARLASYVGPSLRDRFDFKFDSLLHRQSRRLDLAETRLALAKLGIDERAVKREVRLRGVLYEPFGEDWPRPKEIDPDCLSGLWITFDDFRRLDDLTGCWRMVEREHWFSGPELDRPCLNRDGLSRVLAALSAPTQVFEYDGSQVVRRLFIVGPDFAQRARAFAEPNSVEPRSA